MKTIPFESKYLSQIAQLFVDEYSEPENNRIWTTEKATEYLKKHTDLHPEYCFISIDSNQKCIGALIASVEPYYDSELLFIETLQVAQSHRKQKIATKLLKTAIKLAKQNKIKGVHFLADARAKFPKSWYQKLGFQLSGWAQYEALMGNIKV